MMVCWAANMLLIPPLLSLWGPRMAPRKPAAARLRKAALGHPGFRHFVRLCVHPSGRIEGFVIAKDDPLGKGSPVLVDRFVWD